MAKMGDIEITITEEARSALENLAAAIDRLSAVFEEVIKENGDPFVMGADGKTRCRACGSIVSE